MSKNSHFLAHHFCIFNRAHYRSTARLPTENTLVANESTCHIKALFVRNADDFIYILKVHGAREKVFTDTLYFVRMCLRELSCFEVVVIKGAYWVDADGNRCGTGATDANGEEIGTGPGGATPVGYYMTSQRGDTVAATDPGAINGGNLGGDFDRQKTCNNQDMPGSNGNYDDDLQNCGVGADNPTDPTEMSLNQEKHSFTVLHRQKSTFYAEMNTLDGGGGRQALEQLEDAAWERLGALGAAARQADLLASDVDALRRRQALLLPSAFQNSFDFRQKLLWKV